MVEGVQQEPVLIGTFFTVGLFWSKHAAPLYSSLTPSFIRHVRSPPARAPPSTLSPPFRCRWNVRRVKSRTPQPPRHASHDTATNAG